MKDHTLDSGTNKPDSSNLQDGISAAENVLMDASAENKSSRIHPLPDSSHDLEAQTSLSLEPGSHAELIHALRYAAQLHRDSAAADERIAQLYESLSQE